MSNLMERLHVSRVNDIQEFQIILLSHFSHSSQIGQQTIIYNSPAGEELLRLNFEPNGTLQSIVAGPSLSKTDIDSIASKVEREILDDTYTQVVRMVAFSNHPVKGYFRWKNNFQILSVPTNAPRPPQAVGDHPFLLEASFKRSSDRNLNEFRASKKLHEIQLTLFLLLNRQIKTPPHSTQFLWAIDTLEETPKSRFVRAGYMYNGYQRFASDFSMPDEQPLPRTDFNEYYNNDAISVGDSLLLPSSIETSLEKLEKISKDQFSQFIRAVYWLDYAMKVHSLSSSGAFIGYANAIETLLPTTPIDRCLLCNTPRDSITSKFRDFMNDYVPTTPEIIEANRDLYNVRSRLAHGDMLLNADTNFYGWDLINNNQQRKLRHLGCSVKVAIYNWLHKLP